MKDIIEILGRELDIQDEILLEQDVRLHQVLHYFTHESSVKDDLLFKGGTCLIKCHLDYPRFSVDLDFTWRSQDDWITAPTKQVRDMTRPARHAWRDALAEAATRFDYDFDPAAMTWGSSSRMGTAQLGFTNLRGEPGSIKVQVNFVEPLQFEPVTRPARTLISDEEPKALRLLDAPALEAYRRGFDVLCYAPREIAAEKVRAILTRVAPKGRDVLDLFLLEQELGVRADDLDDEVQTKLDFALGLGEKYQINLDEAPERLRVLADQDIRGLLLKDIDAEAFDAYRNRLLDHVRRFLV